MRESSPRPKRSDWPESALPLTVKLDEQKVSLPAGGGFQDAPSLAVVEAIVGVPLRDLLVGTVPDLGELWRPPGR